jgi:hypothetical protein
MGAQHLLGLAQGGVGLVPLGGSRGGVLAVHGPDRQPGGADAAPARRQRLFPRPVGGVEVAAQAVEQVAQPTRVCRQR